MCSPNLDHDRLAPLWMPDDVTKVCLLCKVRFTTFNRRHHCRQCGRVVCRKCSSHEKYLPGKGKKVRVCTGCFNIQNNSQIIFKCVALYNYNPVILPEARAIKLPFKAGDVLGILFPDDSGWWLAECNGERGWVPSTFIERP
eukprot:TRINITY_DN8046_c0_g3_i1.p1 TRINITY_DN8046_c0_g3~~TRINITY_DN8046_c0_g3_i1.p1  ORF type:complete len:142 (-),score=27.40 TRINITY_DN8046_c0_g3_i1:59-484(-)